jgi:tripartite-type tricarboxylate transporter receptor subunit TctC
VLELAGLDPFMGTLVMVVLRDAKLVALEATRAAQAPTVPSVAELGLAQLVSENFVGISAPAGLPRALAEKIASAVRQISARPEFAQTLDQ